MEILLITITILLIFICYILLKTYYHLKEINSHAYGTLLSISGLHHYTTGQYSESIEEIRSNIDLLTSKIDMVEQELSNIRYVTDVILEYKLPTKEERDAIDRII